MFAPTLSRRQALCLLLAAVTSAVSAQSGPWPNKPIKLVVAGPAGAGSDVFARQVANGLQASLKQPVVAENKAGANGLIANGAVAKAAPDGYTFLFAPSSSIALNPIIHSKMPYDTEKDLIPVAQIGAAGILLMTNPASGFKSLADVVRYVKANPGKLTYATWGIGSTGHLVMEGIKAQYKLDMPHVPYTGTAAELTDLLADNIRVAFTDIATPVPYIKAGKLVALGATGSARGPALPGVPTLAEQGFKFDAEGWYGVFAPAGTPPAIVQKMNEEINKVLATNDMKQRFADQNMLVPPVKSADQFGATVKSDVGRWQALAKDVDLKLQ